MNTMGMNAVTDVKLSLCLVFNPVDTLFVFSYVRPDTIVLLWLDNNKVILFYSMLL